MVTAAGGLIALFRDLWSERKLEGAQTTAKESDDELVDAVAAARPAQPPTRRSPHQSLPNILESFSNRFPVTSSTISRLPLSLLPFAGGTFILARALATLGWTSIWATWLSRISTTPANAVFFLGYFIPFVLCPLAGTNIGAAVRPLQRNQRKVCPRY